MSFDEDEDVVGGFKMSDDGDEEPLGDMPADLDFGLDDEDPDKDH